jgi:hypothetical protein
LKCVVVLIILSFSCCAFAQPDAPDEYYSHLSVVVGGAPCTVIGHAIVQDAGGVQWNLPDNLVLPKRSGEPCPTRLGYTKNSVMLTVTATSAQLGAILSKPGSMTIVRGDTAGWLSVKTNGIAKPGLSLDERCQRAIRGTGPLMSYQRGDSGIKQLVPIISSGGIDVYSSASSFRESVQETRYGGFFWSDLFLVFRDEDVRQKAIQAITANNRPTNANNVPSTANTKVTITETKPVNYKHLKYVRMRVAYYPNLYIGPNDITGATVQGPVLDVGESVYIEPLRCTSSGASPFFPDKTGNIELIETVDPGVSTLIGREYGFTNYCTNCPSWSLLAGDLTPLRTAGGWNIIRVDKQHSPFLVQIIDAMEQRLVAARQNPAGKDSVK